MNLTTTLMKRGKDNNQNTNAFDLEQEERKVKKHNLSSSQELFNYKQQH